MDDSRLTRLREDLEKDQVAGFGFASRDDGTYLSETFRRQPSEIPAVSAVIDDPADKSRAVKTRRRGRSAPDVGITKILLSLGDHLPELFIGQGFAGDIVVQHILNRDGVRVVSEDIRLVAERLHQEPVSHHLIIREACRKQDVCKAFIVQCDVQDIVVIRDLIKFIPLQLKK